MRRMTASLQSEDSPRIEDSLRARNSLQPRGCPSFFLFFSPLVFLLIVLLFTFSSISSVSALTVTLRPSSWIDDASLASNETYAADVDNTSFATMSSGIGGLSYILFNASGVANPAVLAVNLTYDYNTSGFSDDLWSFLWSEDNGSSWSGIEDPSSTNQPRIKGLTSLFSGGSVWYWDALLTNLSVRFVMSAQGGTDAANIFLYDVFLTVLLDAEGPNITLVSPYDNEIFFSSNREFTFSAVDVLANLTNCSLFVNDLLNTTNSSPLEGTNMIFNVSFSDGDYSWYVMCYDNATVPQFSQSDPRTLRVDVTPPNVTLISPANATPYTGNQPIRLEYDLDDISETGSCSLFINGTLNQTNPAWSEPSLFFLVYLDNGMYSWQVNCTDEGNLSGLSPVWEVNVSANEAPTVGEVVLSQNISLGLGAPTVVWCNSTVSDESSGDISSVQMSFYREGFAEAADEESVHYSNTSCAILPLNATSREVNCAVTVTSIARHGTWLCALEATDTGGLVGFTLAQTTMLELYAFNLSPSYIQYGTYVPGATSSTRVVEVQNLGNAPFDISLDAFGSVDGDGLAMTCDFGNITLSEHRYSLVGMSYTLMTSLTDDPVHLQNFDLFPGNETVSSSRDVIFRIRMLPPLNGTCSGFVTFTAIPT